MRSKLRRLQKAMRGTLVAIPQRDGSVFHLDPDDAVRSVFHFWSDSVMADSHEAPRPSPPPVLRAVANAKDRRDAYEKLVGGYPYIPIDPELLVQEGRFEPVSIVVGTSYEPIPPEE